jgi:hypothetical protein
MLFPDDQHTALVDVHVQGSKVVRRRSFDKRYDRCCIIGKYDTNITAAGSAGFVNQAGCIRGVGQIRVASIEYAKLVVNAEFTQCRHVAAVFVENGLRRSGPPNLCHPARRVHECSARWQRLAFFEMRELATSVCGNATP